MDLGSVLFHILVVLVAAKLAAEVAERVAVPTVVAEILAGVLVGPSALGLVRADEVLRTLGELGVILLLLRVGMELDLADLGAVGRASLVVTVIGVAVSFGLGTGVALAFGQTVRAATFVGAALTATSVGISARVLGDLGALASVEARTVIAAAVADDVLCLTIFTVVAKVVTGSSVTVVGVAAVVGLAVAYLVVATGVSAWIAPRLFGLVARSARSESTLLGLALAFALGLSVLARGAGLAALIGAFVAGLALARSDEAERISHEMTPVAQLFVPVFFLQIGIDARLSVFRSGRVVLIALCLLAVAVVGKTVAGAGIRRRPSDRLMVGFGMLPRGEVTLIFAGFGLRTGVIRPDLYGALLVVVLGTTLLAPPLLGWRLSRRGQTGLTGL
jgi:Kef-type K+ transport system membrane component KefB